MREHAPITIQRMLTLRQYPGFADAELAELATIAENVVERTFLAGTTVAAPGQRVPAIHLIVDGRLVAADHVWGPHQLVGALEAIVGRPVAARVVAAADTRTLQLSTAAFAEILEDNYSVLASVRRTLARRLLALGATASPIARSLVELTGAPLGLVDRLLVLRAELPFARASLQALSTLAQAADEVHFPAGVTIARAGDAADVLVVLDGAARIGAHVIAGSAIGGIEALAELPHARDVDAITELRALRLPAAALFDVMEDHTDFALAIASRLAGALLDRDELPPEVN